MLALRVHLSLTDFVCQVMAYYNIAPTLLTPGAWQTILGFKALCVDFTSSSYSLEDFVTVYTMKKIPYGVRFFG